MAAPGGSKAGVTANAAASKLMAAAGTSAEGLPMHLSSPNEGQAATAEGSAPMPADPQRSGVQPYDPVASAASPTATQGAPSSKQQQAGLHQAGGGPAATAPRPPQAAAAPKQPPVRPFGNPAMFALPGSAGPGMGWAPGPSVDGSGGGRMSVVAIPMPRSPLTAGSDRDSGGNTLGSDSADDPHAHDVCEDPNYISDEEEVAFYEGRWRPVSIINSMRAKEGIGGGEEARIGEEGSSSQDAASSGEEEASSGMVGPGGRSGGPSQQQQELEAQEVETGRAQVSSSTGGGVSHAHQHQHSPNNSTQGAASSKQAQAGSQQAGSSQAPPIMPPREHGSQEAGAAGQAPGAAGQPPFKVHKNDQLACDKLAAMLPASGLAPAVVELGAPAIMQQLLQLAALQKGVKAGKVSACTWVLPLMCQQLEELCRDALGLPTPTTAAASTAASTQATASLQQQQQQLLQAGKQLLQWVNTAAKASGLATSYFTVLSAPDGGLLLRAVAGPAAVSAKYRGLWDKALKKARDDAVGVASQAPILVVGPGGLEPSLWGVLAKVRLTHLSSAIECVSRGEPAVYYVHCPQPTDPTCLAAALAVLLALQGVSCWPHGWPALPDGVSTEGSGGAAAAAVAAELVRAVEALVAQGGGASADVEGEGAVHMSRAQFLSRYAEILHTSPAVFLSTEQEKAVGDILRGLENPAVGVALSEQSTQVTAPQQIRDMAAAKGKT